MLAFLRAGSFFARTQELNGSKVIARLLARSVALMVFCDSDSKTCPTRDLRPAPKTDAAGPAYPGGHSLQERKN
jgi:hypothetical protein